MKRNFCAKRSPRPPESDLSLSTPEYPGWNWRTPWKRSRGRRTALYSSNSVEAVAYASVEYVNGSVDRLPDHECGAGLVLLRGRRTSPGRLPERVQDVREGITCPGCGGVVWEARALNPGDSELVMWHPCMSLAEIRSFDPELERIKSFEQMAREEAEGEERYFAHLKAEQELNNNEGNSNE